MFKFLKIILIVVTGFCALSAFCGGIGLIFGNGMDMPKEWIQNSFSNFLIPGLILFFIVGGTNLFAAIAVAKNWKYAMESAAVAGFGLQIWIYTELYLVLHTSFLQTFYFALGTLILVIAFLNNSIQKQNI